MPDEKPPESQDNEPVKAEGQPKEEAGSAEAAPAAPSAEEKSAEPAKPVGKVVATKAEEPTPTTAGPVLTAAQFKKMNRRELLKLTPLAAAGILAFPQARDKLLEKGLRFSDWASGKYFRASRLAPTFKDSQVVAFENFPYNG